MRGRSWRRWGLWSPFVVGSAVAVVAVGLAPAVSALSGSVPGAPSVSGVAVSVGHLGVSVVAGGDGGSPITGFRATCVSADGGVTKSSLFGLLSPLVVSGLTAAKSYTCAAVAKNAVGTSAASAPFGPVVMPGVPDAPSIVSATATVGTITILITPGSDNGAPITGYRATCASPDGGTTKKSAYTLATSLIVTGVTKGAIYTCTAVAKNAVGVGLPSSPSAPVVMPGVPAAPTITNAIALVGAIRLAVTPGADNGAPITGYQATCTSTDGGTTKRSTLGLTMPIAVTGLTKTKTYTCTAIAKNAVGASNASAPSITVVVPAVISAPTITSISPNRGPVAGGTTITITGTNLSSTLSVILGAVAAPSYTIISNTTIQVTTPAQPASTVDVTVANPTANSPTIPADQYTYEAPSGCTITWTGNANTNTWTEPNNWTGNTLPGPTDQACIPQTETTVTVTQDVTIRSLTTASPIAINSGTLNLNDATTPSSINGLTLSGGTIAGSSVLTLDATSTFVSGRLSGPVVVPSGSTLTVTGGGACGPFVSGSLTVQGTLVFAPGAGFCMSDNAVLLNNGLVDVQGTDGTTGSYWTTYPYSSSSRVVNNGTWRKSSGASGALIGTEFDNYGTVEVDAGTLDISGSSAAAGDTGSVTIASGATLNLSGGGTRTFAAGSSMTGAGQLVIAGATIAGAVTLAPNTVFVSGRLSGPVVVPSGSTLTVTGGGACGPFVSGSLTVQGTLVFAPGAGFCMSDNAVLLNNGLVDVQGTDGTTGSYWTTYPYSSSSRVVNNGTWRKSSGASGALIGTEFDNYGTVEVDAGTLDISGSSAAAGDTGSVTIASGATLNLSGGGTRTFAAGSSMTGAGQLVIAGTVLFHHGRFSVGSLSVSSGATLEMRLGGSVSGSGFPQIAASSATLDGTLLVSQERGYCAQPSDTFDVVTYGTRSGSFASFASQPGGLTFGLTYTSSAAVVDVASGGCDVTPPTITSASLEASPSAGDVFLQTQLSISALDNAGGTGVFDYSYGWSAGWTATSPQFVASCGVSCSAVSWGPTQPDSDWTFFVRANDWADNHSAWTIQHVHTPKVPVLVALGDSITAGHHKDYVFGRTVCNDATYGYPNFYNYTLAGEATFYPQWTPTYENDARSGFGTADVITGGQDACGASWSSTLQTAAATLHQHAGSWNRIVVTAGVDDTNWTEVVSDVAADSWAGANPFYSLSSCQNSVDGWTGWSSSVRTTITDNVAFISQYLLGSAHGDPTARLTWLSYYDIAGTGPTPAICADPFDTARQMLDITIQNGLKDVPHVWVDVNAIIGGRGDLLQGFYATDVPPFTVLPGWPHPNTDGAIAIADQLAP